MREITISEIAEVSGGSEAYDAGYAVGNFVGKTSIALAVAIAIYTAVATS
ncbi:hypothetical protein [Stenotrophomonas sp. 57]|nr:hypothetical protein [Stenotrophomonas sp. 57]